MRSVDTAASGILTAVRSLLYLAIYPVSVTLLAAAKGLIRAANAPKHAISIHPYPRSQRTANASSECPTPGASDHALSIPYPLALHSLRPRTNNIPLLTQHNNIILTPRAPMTNPKNLNDMTPVPTRLDRLHHAIVLSTLIPARQVRRFDFARVVDEFSKVAWRTVSASSSLQAQ